MQFECRKMPQHLPWYNGENKRTYQELLWRMNIYKAFNAVPNILAIVIIILWKVYYQCCNVNIIFVFKSTEEKLQQCAKTVCWVKKVNLIQHFWNICILNEDTFLSKWWREKWEGLFIRGGYIINSNLVACKFIVILQI